MANTVKLFADWFSEFFKFCPLGKRYKDDGEIFRIIGHRGSPTNYPENTIASFEQAVKEGANGLEVDLSITRDSVVVLWHDWDPNDTDAILRESGFEPFVKYKPHPPDIMDKYRKRISNLSLTEFRQNFDYKIRFEDGAPARAELPTISDFFKWLMDKKTIKYLYFDIKCPHEEHILTTDILKDVQYHLNKYRPDIEAVFECTDMVVYDTMKKQYPHLHYSFDVEPSPGFVLDPTSHSAVKKAIELGNKDAVALRPRKITIANWTTYRRILRHDVKLRVNYNNKNPGNMLEPLIAATVTKKIELRCLVRMGVGGIQTDLPGVLFQLAEKFKRRLE